MPPPFLVENVIPFLSVRDFSLPETLILALVVAFGISFVSWLVAGYYERRGGFGKK